MKGREDLVRESIRALRGPSSFCLPEKDAIAVSLVRDGQTHVRSFIEHHLSLGFKRIVLLDNGSTDRTIEIAGQFPSVTVLQSRLPFRQYKNDMRRFLVTRLVTNRWVLYADIDECFDYPFSGQMSLMAFISNLTAKGFTAVVGQMLDLFSEGLHAREEYYDISAIRKADYSHFPLSNEISNPAIKFHFGGIHGQVFGLDDILLTKHPFLFSDGDIRPFVRSSHEVENAHIADISCVLYHRKFAQDFPAKVRAAVTRKNYWQDSEQYRKYLSVIRKTPFIPLRQPTSKQFRDFGELVREGFIVVSDDYLEWVKSR